MTDDVKAAGERFLSEYREADSQLHGILRQKGRKLALELRSAAIALGMNKATEFSPDIPTLILLAAKVAWLSFDEGASEIEPFERDVNYYANFTPPHPIVADYAAFKKTPFERREPGRR